jgi:hypothetical protein
MKSMALWPFGLLILCLAQLPASSAPKKTSATKSSSPMGLEYSESAARWMTEPWDGDEKPFIRCRLEIRKLISPRISAQQAFTTYLMYKAQARANPNDALAQFAWTYAAFAALRYHQAALGQKILLSNVGSGLARAKSPRTYEFARLRFLYEVRHGGYPQTLKKVAERLILKNRKDYQVRFWYFEALDLRKPVDRKYVENQIEQLVKEFPEEPSRIGLKGYVYFRLWCVTNNPVHAKKAEQAYLLYLRQPGVDSSEQKSVQSTLALMKRWQARRQKNKS